MNKFCHSFISKLSIISKIIEIVLILPISNMNY